MRWWVSEKHWIRPETFGEKMEQEILTLCPICGKYGVGKHIPLYPDEQFDPDIGMCRFCETPFRNMRDGKVDLDAAKRLILAVFPKAENVLIGEEGRGAQLSLSLS